MKNLRRRAIEILNDKEALIDNRNLKELIEELNVFQVELELQNQELREKELQLLQTQDELSFLFNNAPIGYLVLDENFLITKFNKIACDIFNFMDGTRQIFMHTFLKDRHSINEFLEWTNGITYEKLITQIVDTTGTKKYIELQHVEEYFENKRLHLISVSDVTKEMEKKEKLHIFDTILEQLPVCIIITDKQGIITYVNKEVDLNTGYKSHELIGQKTSIFKSGFTSKEEYKKLWETVLEGNTWRGLFKNLTKDKQSHWMATAITPIFDNKGNISHFISVESNIDEKIKMEEGLKIQENIMLVQSRHAAMGEMISMIAHQWRQPLSLISTIASSIQLKRELGTFDIDNDLSDLNEIVQTTKYLSETIDDFRNFFQQDKVTNEIDAQSILNKLLKLNSKVLTINSIKLTIDNQSKNTIRTHNNEILQVLVNLINNSKDALLQKDNKSDNKEIFIKTYDKKENIVFEINDTAGGIPKNIIQNIFEPYFTTKGPTSGTGLGLYITKTIVDKHLQGTIHVSNNENGALFIMDIPNLPQKLI